ncbi:MAG TPA: 6-phosphofructokinase, partial [Acidimicrobiales bacterium]|nr:6-phosphofructokinase [Acidimicrobiales bacterium]
VPFDLDTVCDRLRRRHDGGQFSSIVVVAEGALPAEGPDLESARRAATSGIADEFGHARLGGIAAWLAEEIERRTGYESRVTAFGHILRGGSPTAFDRVLATRFGVEAVRAVHEGAFGTMVALRCGQIVRVPLHEAVSASKTVEMDLYRGVAELFLG